MVAKKQKALKSRSLSWDWKDCPSAPDLQDALKEFGIVVTVHPACEEGSDTFGVIFSNRPLTEEELEEARDER
jgi:hypothetical protein